MQSFSRSFVAGVQAAGVSQRQQVAGVSIVKVRVKALMIAKTVLNMEAIIASRGWED